MFGSLGWVPVGPDYRCRNVKGGNAKSQKLFDAYFHSFSSSFIRGEEEEKNKGVWGSEPFIRESALVKDLFASPVLLP